jgi:ABC-type multidrug transport system fused ATPase/permease subunit
MKLVKLSAWEGCFGASINESRRKELECLWRWGLFNSFQSMFWEGLPVLVSCATIITFALTGHTLTPAIAFTALSLFSILEFPLLVVPYVISDVIEGAVSLKRLSNFLLEPDLQSGDEAVQFVPQPPDASLCACIDVQSASFVWDDDHTQPALTDITFTVKPRQHVAIVGPTGCGKSALLLALVGELTKTKGTAIVRGTTHGLDLVVKCWYRCFFRMLVVGVKISLQLKSIQGTNHVNISIFKLIAINHVGSFFCLSHSCRD